MGAKSQAHHLESDHDVTRPASAHGATLQLHPTLPHLVVRQGMEPRNFEAKPMGLGPTPRSFRNMGHGPNKKDDKRFYFIAIPFSE